MSTPGQHDMGKGKKVPWNLSVPKEIKRAMAVYCAENDLEISEVTEQLWREFLESQGTSAVKEEPPKPAPRKNNNHRGIGNK